MKTSLPVVFSAVFAAALPAHVIAVDRLDAPGPGYRQQLLIVNPRAQSFSPGLFGELSFDWMRPLRTTLPVPTNTVSPPPRSSFLDEPIHLLNAPSLVLPKAVLEKKP